MTKSGKFPRIETGVRNLDAIFGGGLPRGSVCVVAGPPGSGKTILAQQICFQVASPTSRILYFNTLSEPTAKTLRYLKQFDFFDAAKVADFQFVDLGIIVRAQGLERSLKLIMEKLKAFKPSMVVIDSFKTFDDLTNSKEELRKFSYEIAVNLMAWETNALLLGEYSSAEYLTNPLFSVTDGLLAMSQRESSGENQRFLQLIKMRGANHSRDEHSFVITGNGIEVFAPRVTIHREAIRDEAEARCRTGISKLDDMLGEGIPRGSSLLITGVAGTGKTALSLEFIYRGALAGEKGILFSFEETTERLLAAAAGMGWDLQREIGRGMIEMVFIAQPEIAVERDLLMMQERVVALGARRVAIDSASVFLHKISDPQIAREKIFQLATIVQNLGAVGFFATDIPYGSTKISRFGVEETVVDGVIVLSSTEEGYERQRYIEVYKLRNAAHLKGRHSMVIAKGGIQVFPRYAEGRDIDTPPEVIKVFKRLTSGVPGLDPLIGGGFMNGSSTLVVGSPGIGKSTLGLQFIIEGAARREPGLIFTLEESPPQILATADAMGLPLRKFVEGGVVDVLYLPHERFQSAQFLAVLGDKLRSVKARRLLLDGVNHMANDSRAPDELRQLLARLVSSFKKLKVTTVLTAESKSLYFGDIVSKNGFSPVTDNLLMLRYVSIGGETRPALRIIKTRGSDHGRCTYAIEREKVGIRIGDPVRESAWVDETAPVHENAPLAGSARLDGSAGAPSGKSAAKSRTSRTKKRAVQGERPPARDKSRSPGRRKRA